MGRMSGAEKAILAKLKELNKAYDALDAHRKKPLPDPFTDTKKYNDFILEENKLQAKISKLTDELDALQNPQ